MAKFLYWASLVATWLVAAVIAALILRAVL